MPTSTIGTPPPTREARLPTGDGGWLHVEHLDPFEAPSLVVVFVHGFSPYATPYRHVAKALVDEGFAVTLYDARGHGHSTGQRGYIDRFSDYAADLERVVALACAAYPDTPFALIGHSQGGAVVLDYVLPEKVKANRPQPCCVVAAAPMLEIAIPVPWFKRVLSLIFGPLFPKLALGNGIKGELVSRNEEIRRAFGRDPLIHHVATARWFSEARATGQRLRALASKVTIPTLLLTAGQDLIVSAKAQNDFAAAATPGIVEQKSYPRLYHELFLEPERDEVIGDMVAWLQGQVRGQREPRSAKRSITSF